MVETYLKLFTELGLDEISVIMASDINSAKRHLALQVTTIVHGSEAANQSDLKALSIFTDRAAGIARREITLLPDQVIGQSVVNLIAEHGLAVSKSAAKRLCEQGGVKVNLAARAVEVNHVISDEDVIDGVVRIAVGKKDSIALRIS